MSHMIHYENGIGMVLDYTQNLLAASESIFDTEDADAGTIMVGSQEVQVLLKESTNMCQVYRYDDFYFDWKGGELELKDDILKMAENIIAQ